MNVKQEYVSLLIHSDTNDGSTSFVDSSDYGHTVTAVGDARHLTSAAYYDSTGISLDGSGDSLAVTDGSGFEHSGDFTYAFMIKLRPSSSGHIFSGRTDSTSNGITIRNSGYQIQIYYGAGTGLLLSTASVGVGVYTHVAVVRNNGTVTVYINGISAGSVSWSGVIVNAGVSKMRIGELDSSFYLNADLDELLVANYAVWTSNFTVPVSRYNLIYLILKTFTIAHGDILQRTFRATHGHFPQVLNTFRSLCGSAPLRVKTFRVVHDQARSFVKILRVIHQQSTFMQKILRVIHHQQDGIALRTFRAVHGTVAGSVVLKVLRAIHGQVTDTSQVDDFDVSLSVNGQPVLSWSDASLSTDEGRFAWEGQVTVHTAWDGETLLGQFDPVVYHRYGTDYNLIVTDRAMASSITKDEYRLLWIVKLASPSYLLAAGKSVPITKTWPLATAARAIVTEMCDTRSITLDWQAPEYVIGELSVDKQSPMEIIKTVLNTIGALPQSAPDGSLVVRKETPVMPIDGTAEASFDALFINQVSEQSDDPIVLYNAVQVSESADTESGGGLQHTETDRADGGKDIKAWSEPWADISLRVNSAGGETSLSPGILVIEDYVLEDSEPEWVQFVNGKASTSRPVYQGFSVVGFRGDDPGAISWHPDSKNIEASGDKEYYVQVAYQWRYYKFIYYSLTGYKYQVVFTS